MKSASREKHKPTQNRRDLTNSQELLQPEEEDSSGKRGKDYAEELLSIPLNRIAVQSPIESFTRVELLKLSRDNIKFSLFDIKCNLATTHNFAPFKF